MMVISGFALPLTLAHAGVIAGTAALMSVAGGALVYGTSKSSTPIVDRGWGWPDIFLAYSTSVQRLLWRDRRCVLSHAASDAFRFVFVRAKGSSLMRSTATPLVRKAMLQNRRRARIRNALRQYGSRSRRRERSSLATTAARR